MFDKLIENIKSRLGLDMPTPREFLLSCQAFKHSPDASRLSNFIYQFLFVPDEMMRGHCQHSKLEGGMFHGSGYTKNPFAVYKQKLGASSHPILCDTGPKMFRVKGELWLLPVRQLYAIDSYKNNVDVFIRRRIRVQVPYRERYDLTKLRNSGMLDELTGEGDIPNNFLSETQFQNVAAWAYIGNPLYWNSRIDAGYAYSPIRVFQSRMEKIGQYYYFSPAELGDKP